MALIVRYGATSLSSTLNQVANGFCQPKVSVSYGSAAKFTFRLHAPQHTQPIPLRSLIALEDTDYSDHPSRPVFLGHVYDVIPQESNVVDYVCYDVTQRARDEITVMSGPHGDANVIPRLVFNSKIDNDDDYAFEALPNATVGQVIATILGNSQTELLAAQATPLSGAFDAWDSADLSPFDFIPQEKLVFESEKLGSALDRLLSWYPQYRLFFEPGYSGATNRWRFVKPLTGTSVTLTLNDFSGTNKVLSFGIQPNSAGRFPAVKVFGPQQFITRIAYSFDVFGSITASGLDDPGLTEEWNVIEKINFEALGPANSSSGNAGKKWQIANPAKRRISRLLPEDVVLPDSQFNVNGVSYQSRITRQPILQATWEPDGSEWWTVPSLVINYRDGIIETPVAVYQYLGPTNYKLPVAVRLVYAYFGTPLSVRFPTTGWSGTTNSVAGMQVEEKLYDEMLAVGYEKGSPVTTATRLAQFAKLAESLHESVKDIIYTGGCVLEGLQYDFLRLQRRVNFTSITSSGAPLTTGWEAAEAIVTEVEYDYENRVTTMIFSSDYSEFTQRSIDEIKRILQIRALEISQQLEYLLSIADGGILQTVTLRNVLIEDGVPAELITPDQGLARQLADAARSQVQDRTDIQRLWKAVERLDNAPPQVTRAI